MPPTQKSKAPLSDKITIKSDCLGLRRRGDEDAEELAFDVVGNSEDVLFSTFDGKRAGNIAPGRTEGWDALYLALRSAVRPTQANQRIGIHSGAELDP